MIKDYELRKKHHYCVKCGKQDAYTLNGYVLCYECNEKNNAQSRKYRKEKYLTKIKPKYLKQKEFDKINGYCTICHKNKADVGYTTCTTCRIKSNKRAVEYKRRKGSINRQEIKYLGLCYRCCKNPVYENKKLCEECYKKQIESLQKRSNKND